MSEEKKKEGEAKPEAAAAPPAPKKPSPLGGILKVLIPALLAAGASYGGTRYAKAQNAIVVIKEKDEAEGHGKHEVHPPGPTLTLEPFLLSVFDAQKKSHPMKLSIAVEFDEKGGGGEHGGGGEPKVFMPRIRDVVLTFLRTMSYEEITDASHIERMRKELLEKCKDAGAESAQKVLITDFVIQ